MDLAVGLEAGEAWVRQLVGRRIRGDRRRGGGAADPAIRDLGQPDGPPPGRSAREAAAEQVRVELERLEQQPADVRGDGTDAHPGERLAKARLERREEVGDGVVGGQLLGAAGTRRLGRELDGQPRNRGSGADREGHRERVDVEDVGRVGEQVELATEAGLGEGRVGGANGEDRRNWQAVGRETAIREDEELGPAAGGADGGCG